MGIEMGVFLTFGGTLIMIFLFGKALLIPVRIVLRLVLNSIAGAVVVMVINFLGTPLGVMIPLNIVNAASVGLLGVPGVIMLLILCN